VKIPNLLVLPWLLGLSACVSQPVDDASPGERPATDTDEAGLWQMLERDEYKLQTSTGVVRDPTLQAYLESVLCRVVPGLCSDIRLYVLPGGGMNAAMAPNGMMLVFTGLLVRLENEAQLAAVLGHEAAHYVKRHTLQRWRDMRARTATLTTVATVVSAGLGVARVSAESAAAQGNYDRAIHRAAQAGRLYDVGTALIYSLEISTMLGHLAYGREQEMESDELGISWMASAGYDPVAASEIWDYAHLEARAADRWVPPLLLTHPQPAVREGRARTQAAALSAGTWRLGRDAYLSQIAPFRNDWLHLARSGLEVDVLATLLERQRRIGVPEGLVAFHEGTMYRGRGEQGDGERALASFEVATQQPGCPPEAFRELGLAQWDADRYAEAKRAFEDYLAAAPAAADAAMVAAYITELP